MINPSFYLSYTFYIRAASEIGQDRIAQPYTPRKVKAGLDPIYMEWGTPV